MKNTMQINPNIIVRKEITEESVVLSVQVPMYENFKMADLKALKFLFSEETIKNTKVDKNIVVKDTKEIKPKASLLDKALKSVHEVEEGEPSVSKVVAYKCNNCNSLHVGKLHVRENSKTPAPCRTCGEDITLNALKDMPKVRYQCECGGFANFPYALDCKEDEHFELKCVKCGQPKDLYYDSKHHIIIEK